MALNSRALSMARVLRKKMTPTEKSLWLCLRGKKLDGLKFRRQMPLVIGEYNFVADFYCAENRLVIEVDGDIHNNKEEKEYDLLREDILKLAGFKIIRFKNNEVLNNIQRVISEISNTAKGIKQKYPEIIY